VKDANETTLAGWQQLSGGATSYFISVPLTLGTVNHFVVTATDAAENESAAADVLSITQDSSTPAAPQVSDPLTPISINAGSYTISGTASAGTLIKVWRDNNADGVVNGGDTL